MADGNDRAEHEPNRRLTERVLGRLVGPVVSPVVDNVDVDDVVERIDVNHLIDRLDVNGVVDRIDVDPVMQRVDIDALLARVDINEIVDRIEPDRLLDRIDVDRLLDRIDVNTLLDRIEPDQLLDRIDVDRLLDRIDVNTLLDRIEPDRLLDRIDVDRLIDRVDADRLLARVDVNAVVERTEIGAIIARSTTGVFTQLLDVARTQLIGVDQVAQGVAARILRGQAREVPPLPSADTAIDDLAAMTLSERAVALQHHAAGSVSRFLAFLVDQFIIGMLFAGGLLLTSAAARVVLGIDIDTGSDSLPIALAYLMWAFAYMAGSLAATGRTIGKAVLGLQVVEADGSRLRARAALIRTAVFPLSFLLFGIGLLLGLIRRDRRELHDLIAGTAVIYAWDAATARLRVEATAE